MNVVLFFSRFGRHGGISPDIRHLADGLADKGVPVRVSSRLTDILASDSGKGTVVNVYGCLPSVRTVGAMLLARIRGQRLVWTPVFHPGRLSTWKGSGPYRVMELFDWIAPRIARVTHAVSAATEEEAAFFSAMGAPRTAVIPLVVNETHGRLAGAARAKARKQLGVATEPVVLLIAAHSPRRKGMEFARDVLKVLREDISQVTFLVVGGGDLGPLSGEPGVRPLGWCTEEMLVAAYRSADVLFVPSLYEQFSRATIEAWACELPVVLTTGVALAPTAERAGAGRVVAYNDVAGAARTLAQALADREWRLRAGRRGRDLVEQRYLRDHHLQASLALYREIA